MKTKTFGLNNIFSYVVVVLYCALLLAMAVPVKKVRAVGETHTRASLLARRSGYAASVTGGNAEPNVYIVTSNADDPNSPTVGTLRYALEDPSPQWIIFQNDMTITLQEGIYIQSNKTIDGRGQDVTVTTPDPITNTGQAITRHGQPGFLIRDQSNIIIANIKMDFFGDPTLNSNQDNLWDAIWIHNSNNPSPSPTPSTENPGEDYDGSYSYVSRTSNIWIDHVTLSRAGDKLVNIEGGADGVTVSWSSFKPDTISSPSVDLVHHQQHFQIGNKTTKKHDVNNKVTVHHNTFEGGYRTPVTSCGVTHVYNNYIYDWQYFGTGSKRKAQVLSENNVYEALTKSTKALEAQKVDGGETADGTCITSEQVSLNTTWGAYKSVNNLFLNGATAHPNRNISSDVTFAPSYSYVAGLADSSMVSSLKSYAGWQPASYYVNELVGAPNNLPTDITFNSLGVNESILPNQPVGSLFTTDPDLSDEHTYALVSGAGDADNGSFSISGNTVYITVAPDYEVQSSYSIRIRTTDLANGSFEKAIIVNIADVDETLNADSDGVPDAIEDAAFNGGDGNGDGIQDSTQRYVASLHNAITKGSSTLVTDNSTLIQNFSVSSEASQAVQEDGFDYPIGLFDFSVMVDVGTTQTISIFLDRQYDTSEWEWHKLQGETYEDITSQVVFDEQLVGGEAVTTITYDITDGGLLDADGTENGIIVDPAGPAVLAASTPGTTSNPAGEDNSELADTGANGYLVAMASIVLVLTGSTLTTVNSRKKYVA